MKLLILKRCNSGRAWGRKKECQKGTQKQKKKKKLVHKAAEEFSGQYIFFGYVTPLRIILVNCLLYCPS